MRFSEDAEPGDTVELRQEIQGLNDLIISTGGPPGTSSEVNILSMG